MQVPSDGYWLARDLRPLPSSDPGGFPNGDIQPSRLVPVRIQPQRLGKLRSMAVHPRNPLHFPGPLV
jgi:hypothetical protein